MSPFSAMLASRQPRGWPSKSPLIYFPFSLSLSFFPFSPFASLTLSLFLPSHVSFLLFPFSSLSLSLSLLLINFSLLRRGSVFRVLTSFKLVVTASRGIICTGDPSQTRLFAIKLLRSISCTELLV